MPTSNGSPRRQRNVRGGSGRNSRRVIAQQRECEEQRGCNGADSPEKTAWARPMASTRRMLQRLPGVENPSFEFGRSCDGCILLRELTPGLNEYFGVRVYASTRGICRCRHGGHQRVTRRAWPPGRSAERVPTPAGDRVSGGAGAVLDAVEPERRSRTSSRPSRLPRTPASADHTR
jgi:hypothetical protein